MYPYLNVSERFTVLTYQQTICSLQKRLEPECQTWRERGWAINGPDYPTTAEVLEAALQIDVPNFYLRTFNVAAATTLQPIASHANLTELTLDVKLGDPEWDCHPENIFGFPNLRKIKLHAPEESMPAILPRFKPTCLCSLIVFAKLGHDQTTRGERYFSPFSAIARATEAGFMPFIESIKITILPSNRWPRLNGWVVVDNGMPEPFVRMCRSVPNLKNLMYLDTTNLYVVISAG
jgi:hypothetical protein